MRVMRWIGFPLTFPAFMFGYLICWLSNSGADSKGRDLMLRHIFTECWIAWSLYSSGRM